jgi:hypothetical protein
MDTCTITRDFASQERGERSNLASVLKRRSEIETRGPQRRYDAKMIAVRKQSRSKSQHSQIETGLSTFIASPPSPRPSATHPSSTAQTDTQAATQQAEQHAFSQQLSHEARPAGAHCQPDRDFLWRPDALYQQQIRHIRASDEQHQGYDSE